MKHVSIVGIGMGAETVTREGYRAIEKADALVGASRMLEPFVPLQKQAYGEYLPDRVADVVSGSAHRSFAVLVSGDTGFYSAAEGLAAALCDFDVTLIPGVSSLSYFFAKLNRPWQGAKLLSCHGREANLADAVRRNRLTFALTGKNMDTLAARLEDAGFGDLTATVGENLGAPDERILALPVFKLRGAAVGPLAVLLVENPGFDGRVRLGIPDGEFLRGGVPMTKSEVRAVTLSKLSLRPDAVCCDVGAGTGSVTVEMALCVHEGRVFAIDKNEEAIALVRENCRAFHIGNVFPVLGSAPDALEGLPRLDAAFIGGSGGDMGGIVSALLSNNPQIRIVINAIALESAAAAIDAFKRNNLQPEIVQVGCARARAAGGLHMMTAENPVFVISGGGHE
ncbi:MAG: precorrin-6y C5,15-methyltransferase (decarboxylating) subunit CbiE [Bacillota bacterium]